LNENGKTKLTDIDIEASNTSLYRALNILARLDLITEERAPPYTRYILLTEDGKAVAKRLDEIEFILAAKKERQKHQNTPTDQAN
jgi:DNA-binding PadR family transcriptional regulator